jgi:hypothetical protein
MAFWNVLREFFANVFSFLGTRSTNEERVAAYILREHDRGRDLDAIVDDSYVVNRVSPHQLARLLERPEIVHAIGEDIVASTQEQLT